jgi:FKBP-type peptidyl-prolyl cis-trans isomerase
MMKKLLLPVAVLGVLTLQGCNQQSETTAPAEPEAVALDTPEQRLSYGIGQNFGMQMKNNSLPIDPAAFSAGLLDAMEGRESRLTPEEISTEMQAFQQRAQAEQAAARAAAGEANAEAGQAFLAQNAAREGVVVTDSGLQYEVIEQGEGAVPGAEDTVEVHYRGTLIDGTEFDSSYKRGQTVSFGVGQVIPGWTEALQMMPVGSKWKLFIPSELAYGAGGAGNAIGPNATLLFDVELVSIAGQEAGAGEAAGDDEG